MKPKVAVIELNDYHTEAFVVFPPLLPTLFNCKKEDIVYLVNEKKVSDVGQLLPNVRQLPTDKIHRFLMKLGLTQLADRQQIRLIMKKEKPDFFVMNTIDGKRHSRYFHALPKQKVGIIHNPFERYKRKKFNLSTTLIFCYSFFNFEYLSGKVPIHGYFSPVFQNFCFEKSEETADNTIKLFIQGHIEYHRRDYPSLIPLARYIRDQGLPIVFNIVGNAEKADGPDFRQSVQKAGVEEIFQFHGRLSDRDFFKQIDLSHYCMPLIGEEQAKYLKGKSTHSYSHALAYNKPMIAPMHVLNAFQIPSNASIGYETHKELVEKLATLQSDTTTVHVNLQAHRENIIKNNIEYFQTMKQKFPSFFKQLKE